MFSWFRYRIKRREKNENLGAIVIATKRAYNWKREEDTFCFKRWGRHIWKNILFLNFVNEITNKNVPRGLLGILLPEFPSLPLVHVYYKGDVMMTTRVLKFSDLLDIPNSFRIILLLVGLGSPLSHQHNFRNFFPNFFSNNLFNHTIDLNI